MPLTQVSQKPQGFKGVRGLIRSTAQGHVWSQASTPAREGGEHIPVVWTQVLTEGFSTFAGMSKGTSQTG